LPSPPPTSSTVSPPGVSVGVPVGPIRITGSPGFEQRAEVGRAAHLQHDGRERPRSRSTEAPVSEAFHRERVPSTRARQRLEVLQPVELPGLEGARRHRRATTTSTMVRRQADDVMNTARSSSLSFTDQRSGVGTLDGRALREHAAHYRVALLRAAHRLDDVAGERRMEVAEEAGALAISAAATSARARRSAWRSAPA
jgi:hypothetical protein